MPRKTKSTKHGTLQAAEQEASTSKETQHHLSTGNSGRAQAQVTEVLTRRVRRWFPLSSCCPVLKAFPSLYHHQTELFSDVK